MSVLLVGIGGFLGAIARYVLGTWMNKKSSKGLPIGTLFINLLGSFLLGWMVGQGVTSGLYSFLGIGFIGSFTTFSTFKLESVQLHQNKKHSMFYSYLAYSYIGGILLAFVGISLSVL
ncbi:MULTISPECIES: fluoride efflux transporter CrcB [Priestia]|jgi:fluoride exporter|uniref:Fluoride-specific ion channel FluC n=1 Tax=Priestia megaterium (strain ATCC 12872 / QMB1551) TaxID=545693 RepID=D5E4B3_PRIM1|nr:MULTISPECIES: fluoride efflux transporter CrcB [Priestia]ADE72638.1 CrcB-like protein [Priestia megaterium QM B1551]